MFTKPLMVTIIAACNFTSPDGSQPPIEVGEDQHFCCQSVDADKYTGEGCVTIVVEQVNQCNQVLYCDARWTKKDGNVKCE